MRMSRGMGDMKASKMPKGKTIVRKDKPQDVTVYKKGGKVGLYANIHAKQERIKAGSGEKMRKPGTKGAPTAEAFAKSKETVKMAGGKWIQGAIKKPGALRAQLGVPKGEKIPAKKLAKAAKAPGKLGQRARFAEVLKGMKKK
ncbi:MAG: hypothetical protein ACO3AG_00645 [Fluviibacter sp.]